MNIELKEEDSTTPDAEAAAEVLSDPKYICKSCDLITESLKKGCDIIQMPNGDIIVTEVQVITSTYSWDNAKEKMVKVSSQVGQPKLPV